MESQFLPLLIVYIDTESSLNTQFLQAIGVDTEKMVYLPLERPVNNFNGINLVGLQHGNGERNCFEPTGAFFVEMDYDGYHPRLIGEMVGFSFGERGVHVDLLFLKNILQSILFYSLLRWGEV